MTVELGQEIWLKPGIWGFGYYVPQKGSEQFRLRGTIWDYANWFFLGYVTDTAQPDLDPNSSDTYLEFKAPNDQYYYIKIDDSLDGRIEAVTPSSSNNVDFEATVVKDKSELENISVPKTTNSLPWWKRNLASLIAGVIGLVAITAIATKKKKPANMTANTPKMPVKKFTRI